MLRFSAGFQLDKQLEGIHEIHDYQFKMYEAHVATSTTITVLIPNYLEFEEGSIVFAPDCYITHIDKVDRPKQLALRVAGYAKTVDDFKLPNIFKLRINGAIERPKKDELQIKGVVASEFYSFTIRINDEYNERFRVWAIAFGKVAKRVFELEARAYCNWEAGLTYHKNDGVPEFNVTGFEVLE